MRHDTADDAATVVSLPAEIDILNARRIRGVLMSAAGPGVKTVVADLTRTAFCDCEGAYSLAQAYTQLAARDVDLRLVMPAAAVRRVFAMLALDRVVRTYDSLDAAITAAPVTAAPVTAAERASAAEPGPAG